MATESDAFVRAKLIRFFLEILTCDPTNIEHFTTDLPKTRAIPKSTSLALLTLSVELAEGVGCDSKGTDEGGGVK